MRVARSDAARDRLRVAALAFLLIVLPSTGCGEAPGRKGLDAPLAELDAGTRADFLRHYLQGLQLARGCQFGRAMAEFDRCLDLFPKHPDLRFQRGRLLWHRGDKRAAIEQLEAALGHDPDHEAAHAFLADVYASDPVLGDRGKATSHRRALSAAYGGMLDFNQKVWDRLFAGSRRNPYARIQSLGLPGAAGPSDDPLVTLASAFHHRRINRDEFRPVLADRMYRDLFARYPLATAVSVEYADWLQKAVIRFPLQGPPGEPPMTSSITLDRAQQYYEQVLDVCRLDSPIAHRARLGLAGVAFRMGDWDDALRGYAAELGQPGLTKRERQQAWFHSGVACFRAGDLEAATRWLTRRLTEENDLPTAWILSLLGENRLSLREEAAPPGLKQTLRFEDVAPRLGVAKVDGAGPSAWGDYDLDGDLDLFVAGCDTFCALYRYDDGRFTDVSHEAGLMDVPSGFSGTFADYDNDGRPDLYIGRNGWSGAAPNSLFRNEGDGTFLDVTDAAGVGHPGSSFVHAWSDLDRDGWLDLVVVNGITGDGSTNVVYRNEGDGTFTDVTRACGLQERPGTRTIGLAIGDYDRDGWPDIFFSRGSTPSRLYHNRGDGTFEDVATRAGVDGRAQPNVGYVAFFFDYDNDTWPDLLTTQLAGFTDYIRGQMNAYEPTTRSLAASPLLYRNNGDGTFRNVSREAGLIYPHGTMGANIADVNNDGFVDFYLGTGDPMIERLEPNAFYASTGDGAFVELTRHTGLGHLGKGHGITFADYDFDGDLDIYAPQGGFEHGDLWPNALYRNDAGNRGNWLQILLVGVDSNRMGVGAQVTLRAGDMTLYREATAGGAFGSSSTPFLHFGLGSNKSIEAIEVLWPSGQRASYRQPPINRFLRLVEGAVKPEVLAVPATPG